MSQKSKKKWLAREDWFLKKKSDMKDKIRLKYTTPKQRSRRRWVLECRLEAHVDGLAKYKRKYERLSRDAQLEIDVIHEVGLEDGEADSD